LQEYIAQIERLQEQNANLEKENTQLKERGVRLTEESNMEKFKCQLLIEMVRLQVNNRALWVGWQLNNYVYVCLTSLLYQV
jgi:hypothetical protein